MAIMDASQGPTRMYALLLKLRPLQQGTLMPFSGELVHGALLNWLRAAAPDVATWLHEGQKRRLFTCSSLHFSQPMQPSLKAERENIHLPLNPMKTYTVRLTFLLGELFPLFYNALMQSKASEAEATSVPFIRLGKQWTNFTSPTSLIEKAEHMRFSTDTLLTLEFGSLTAFSRGHSRTGYGMHHMIFPLPQLVFQNLLRRWEDIVPAALADVIHKERIEQYLQEDGVVAIDYDLTAHHVHFTTHLQRGFLGTCTYQLRGPDEKTGSDSPLTLKQQIYLLAQLAFYCGVGHKTAMGLGQTRLRT